MRILSERNAVIDKVCSWRVNDMIRYCLISDFNDGRYLLYGYRVVAEVGKFSEDMLRIYHVS